MGSKPGKLVYEGSLGAMELPRYSLPRPNKSGVIRLARSKEAFRFVLSALWLIIAGIMCSWTQSKSDERWVDHAPGRDPRASPPLYDSMWNASPDLSDKLFLTDVFVLGLLAATVVLMAVFVATTWRRRAILFRRIFWIMGALYWYRALTLTVTTLPATHNDCQPVLTDGDTFGEALQASIDMIFGSVKACTDNIFSGHTMFLMTCVFQWRIYCRFRPAAWLVYAIAFTGILIIDFTHLHYTVDIVLAMFITWGAYSIYFGCLRIAVQRLEYDGHLRGHSDSGARRWEKADPAYQDLAYTPRMINSGLIATIAWLDGLDLRWDKREGRLRSESQLPMTAPSPEASSH